MPPSPLSRNQAVASNCRCDALAAGDKRINRERCEAHATLTNSTGQVKFTDAVAANFSQRFYRVEVK
jgi:hypothetical protein